MAVDEQNDRTIRFEVVEKSRHIEYTPIETALCVSFSREKSVACVVDQMRCPNVQTCFFDSVEPLDVLQLILEVIRYMILWSQIFLTQTWCR